MPRDLNYTRPQEMRSIQFHGLDEMSDLDSIMV